MSINLFDSGWEQLDREDFPGVVQYQCITWTPCLSESFPNVRHLRLQTDTTSFGVPTHLPNTLTTLQITIFRSEVGPLLPTSLTELRVDSLKLEEWDKKALSAALQRLDRLQVLCLNEEVAFQLPKQLLPCSRVCERMQVPFMGPLNLGTFHRLHTLSLHVWSDYLDRACINGKCLSLTVLCLSLDRLHDGPESRLVEWISNVLCATPSFA